MCIRDRPYTPPPETPQAGDRYRGPRPRRRRQSLINDHPSRSGAAPTDRHQQPRQERQVRLTAQDILIRNLRLPYESHRRWWVPWRGVRREPPWPGIRLNLKRALLLDVSLTNCRIAEADFDGAQFTGGASFDGVQFTGRASFYDAQFHGGASFDGAQFTGLASFAGAQFTGLASFARAQFHGLASFARAQFHSGASFDGAQFTRLAYFARAQFHSGASFDGAQFTGVAYFASVQFTRVTLGGARFTGRNRFDGVLETVWPPGWTTRTAQPDNGEDPAAQYLVQSEDPAG